jgi:hypothetical protein
MFENRINLSAAGGAPTIQPIFTGSESAAFGGGGGFAIAGGAAAAAALESPGMSRASLIDD